MNNNSRNKRLPSCWEISTHTFKSHKSNSINKNTTNKACSSINSNNKNNTRMKRQSSILIVKVYHSRRNGSQVISLEIRARIIKRRHIRFIHILLQQHNHQLHLLHLHTLRHTALHRRIHCKDLVMGRKST